jgi:hypothetical protein
MLALYELLVIFSCLAVAPRPGMDQGKGWPEVLRFEWFCGHDIAPLVERRALVKT